MTRFKPKANCTCILRLYINRREKVKIMEKFVSRFKKTECKNTITCVFPMNKVGKHIQRNGLVTPSSFLLKFTIKIHYF